MKRIKFILLTLVTIWLLAACVTTKPTQVKLPDWDGTTTPSILDLTWQRNSYQVTYKTVDGGFATTTIAQRNMENYEFVSGAEKPKYTYALPNWDGTSTPQVTLMTGEAFVHLKVTYQTITGSSAGRSIWIVDLEQTKFTQ